MVEIKSMLGGAALSSLLGLSIYGASLFGNSTQNGHNYDNPTVSVVGVTNGSEIDIDIYKIPKEMFVLMNSLRNDVYRNTEAERNYSMERHYRMDQDKYALEQIIKEQSEKFNEMWDDRYTEYRDGLYDSADKISKEFYVKISVINDVENGIDPLDIERYEKFRNILRDLIVDHTNETFEKMKSSEEYTKPQLESVLIKRPKGEKEIIEEAIRFLTDE